MVLTFIELNTVHIQKIRAILFPYFLLTSAHKAIHNYLFIKIMIKNETWVKGASMKNLSCLVQFGC